MELRRLGWAGVEIESAGDCVVVDLIGDAGGVVEALGDRAAEVPLPELVPAKVARSVVGLVTHLHRDHTDAGALARALAPGAPVLRPEPGGGDDHENLWLLQAEAELDRHRLLTQVVGPWATRSFGPFAVTALPAVDAIGDPQVSWAIEAEGRRVVHLGDSMFHGYWWRMSRRHGPFDVAFVPINGASVCFPHCQPPSPRPAALDPELGALTGHLLGAKTVIPIHYGGFEIDPFYVESPHALKRFTESAAQYDYEVVPLAPGEALTC
jgi:L-ascorbate metabolism protein UlaG (beta-lactamase superfamily)